MALPYVFASLSGNQPGSTLDSDFNAVAQMGSIFCSSAGTNAITLTPNANQPDVISYTNNTLFAFNASATPTGAVTLQVGSLGALNVYYSDGATQINAGAFIEGQFVIVVYLASLNSGAGGFSFVNGALISALLDLQIGSTQGSILYRDASGWKALAPGTSGDVLTTQGAAANPAWQATGAAAVTSFNTRTGAVTLQTADVTNVQPTAYGAVGSYAEGSWTSGSTNVTPGGTYAGANIGLPTGTWRCMGAEFLDQTGTTLHALFLRIS